MAEIFGRQTGNQVPSELRRKYSEIYHAKETGRIVIYGVSKKTKKKEKIGSKQYVKSYGHNPGPQRVMGMWHSAGGDAPVIISGTHGRDKDGVEHLRAHGTKEKIPRNNIEWIGSRSESNGSRVDKLEKQIGALTSRLLEMEDRLKKQDKRNRKLQKKNTDLQARLDRISHGELPLETEVYDQPSSSKPRSFFNRGTGWIGSRMPWRGEPSYVNHRVEERDEGPVLVATEERVDGYRIEDRRRGVAMVLGTVAAIGIGVLAAGLWGEHEEQEGREQAPTITLPSTPHIKRDATAGAGQRQEVLFHGNKAFKVSLPGNLNWEENSNGSYRIDDTQGHHIVPRVYWDQQGDLDVDSRQLLRTTPYHNFRLKQVSYDYHTPGTNFDQHYETVIENQ